MSMRLDSPNYHFSSDRIGTGSSCDVYKGLHKVTFAAVALKVLKDHSWRKEIDKEVAALVKLESHPNIVRFYGKEIEITKKLPCIVVEYCDQGSLHSVLKEVENKHGLSDCEFISLLKDITTGLEHLHKHGCIHRDIKPGNILKSSRSDGKSTYKLSDFGASRMSSGADEGFFSLAGTEEYLHPDMYEKAFINRRIELRFDHRADMWSLGCTLYQAITGEMPYKPFDGARNNRSIMFQMVGRKPKGGIAGYQRSSDGEIIWLYTLPADCNMTRDLRRHLLPILVGLMERGQSQWTFETYRKAVGTVLNLKRVVVMDSEDISMHYLYMKRQKSLAEFKERVSSYTDIHSDHQKMYYNQMSLSYFLNEDATVDTFPDTDMDNPILVFSTQSIDYHFNYSFSLEPYDSFRNSTMSTITEDISVAASQCQTIHQLYTRMVDAKAIVLCLFKMTLILRTSIVDRCKVLQSRNREWYEWLDSIARSVQPKNGERQTVQTIYEQTRRVRQSIDSLASFEHVADTPKVLVDDWCAAIEGEFSKSKELLNRMHHRKHKVLTDYEHAEHQADAVSLQEMTARCVHLWQSRCSVQVTKSIREFVKLKSIYKEKVRKLVMLENNMKDFHKKGVKLVNTISSKSKGSAEHQTKPPEYSIKKMCNSDSTLVRRSLHESRDVVQGVCQLLEALPEVFALEIDDLEEIEGKMQNEVTPNATPKSNEPQSVKDMPDIATRHTLSNPKGGNIIKNIAESGIFTGIIKSS